MEFEYYEEDSEYQEYEEYDYDYDYDDYEERAEKLEIPTTTARPPKSSVLIQPNSKRPPKGRFQDPFRQQFLQSPIQQQLLQQNLHLQQLQENLRLQKELSLLKNQVAPPRAPPVQPIQIVRPTTRKPTLINTTNRSPLDKILQQQLEEQKKKLESLEEHLQSITQRPPTESSQMRTRRPGEEKRKPSKDKQPIKINTSQQASLLVNNHPVQSAFKSHKKHALLKKQPEKQTLNKHQNVKTFQNVQFR